MLIRYELRKIFSFKALWVIIALLLIVNSVICYIETEKSTIYFGVEKVIEDYVNDPDTVDAYYKELQDMEAVYNESLNLWLEGKLDKEPVFAYPCTYSGMDIADDYAVLQAFYRTFKADDDHKEILSLHIKNAERYKLEFLGSYGEGVKQHYIYQKQELIANMYTHLLETSTLKPEIGYGWDQLFGFDTVNIFIFISVIFGAAVTVIQDFEGSALLIRATPRGRKDTALAKLSALCIYTIAVVILFMLVTLLAVWIKCGAMSNALNRLGIFHEYRNIPFRFTVCGYFAFIIFVKILAFFAVAVLTVCVCLVVRNVPLGVFSSIAIVGFQYFMYYTSDNDFLKYINIVSLILVTPLVSKFICFSFVGKVMLFLFFDLVAVSAVLIILVIIYVLLFSNVRILHVRFIALRRMNIASAWRWLKNKLLARCSGIGCYSLLYYEFLKNIFSKSAVIMLLAAFALKYAFAFVQYPYSRDYDEGILLTYMKTIEGLPTDEKYEFIANEVTNLTNVIGKYESMKNAYFAGELDDDIFYKHIDDYNYAISHIDVATYLHNHADYIKEKTLEYQLPLRFLYDTDWKRVFLSTFDIVIIAVCIYFCSGIYADEYKKSEGHESVMLLLRSTKKGRRELFRTKIVFAILFGAIIALLFTVLDIVHLNKYYILPQSVSPLMSIELFQNTNTGITLIQYLVFIFVVRFIVCVLFAVLVSVLGSLLRSRFATIIVSFLTAFTPMLATSFGVEWLEYVDITNAFSANELYLLSSKKDFFGDFGLMVFFLLGLLFITVAIVQTAERIHSHKKV